MAALHLKLWNTLRDLLQDDFEDFKRLLTMNNLIPGQTGIPACELEHAGRLQTAIIMIQTYKGAAKVLALEILRKIGQNELARLLENFCETPNKCNSSNLLYKIEGLGEKHAELEKLREFAVDVTLDPDTAHPDMVLSTDGKEAYDTDETKDVPDSPKRFDTVASVLGKEAFSSGKFYFEVAVEGKTAWTVGLAQESIKRKGTINMSPNKGFWTIWLRNKVYEAIDDPSVCLPLKSRLLKIGVFVNYDKAQVSFYNADTADLLYSFTKCRFSKKILPYFGPCGNKGGSNSDPLVIVPIVHKISKAELRSVQQFQVEVTLDPDTAHPELILSADGKQVHHSDQRRCLPDSPRRFSDCVNVLGKQSFSKERFYFQVQVKGKTDWTLGVATDSADRKGDIVLQPESGFWTIYLRNGEDYEAFDKPIISLSRRSNPKTVGVFVDYEEGLVSFYDADTADLLYSFTRCCFAEKLRPFLSPCTNVGGTNSAPLIISPVCLSD